MEGAPRAQINPAQLALRSRLPSPLEGDPGGRPGGPVTAMRFLRLRRPYPYGAAIGRLIAGVFTDDEYIVLMGDDDARCRVLDRLASELVSLRCRVVRITATGPDELSLQEFVGQLSQQLGLDAGAGDTLERIHRHLTEVDASCDR